MRDRASPDVGTVWTLRRHTNTARCALLKDPKGWELRVIVNGDKLLSKSSGRLAELLTLADAWKLRMTDHGWTSLPRSPELWTDAGPSPAA
jgi:hypothetical protein